MIEKYPDKTVFGNYERTDVLKWINDFRYFTFARGGLNEFIDDGDEFVVSFSYNGKEDLLKKLSGIGVQLKSIAPGTKTFDRKQKVTEENSPKLPDPIENHPDLAQPGFQEVLGVKIYTWIDKEYIWIAVSNTTERPEWWKVAPADVEYCLKLEKHFDTLGLISSRIFQTEEYGRFINRFNYPQYFPPPAEAGIPGGRAGNAN